VLVNPLEKQREATAKTSGEPACGKAPVPPIASALDKDQINLTDAANFPENTGLPVNSRRSPTDC